MRIALLTNSLSGGGIERQAVLLYRELLRKGIPCIAVACEDRADYLTDDEQRNVIFCHKRGRKDTLAVARAVRAAVAEDDVIVSFNWYPAAVAWMARPTATRIMRFGGMLAEDGVAGYRMFLAKRAAAGAAAIVGCSWGVARDAASQLGGATVLCARAANAVAFRSKGGVPESPPELPVQAPYLLHVGRLESVKDQATLVRAFARLAPSIPHRLVVAGSGSLADDLRALTRSLGVEERVQFLGFVDDTAALYEGADVAVFSSRVEGFGTVLVEALAAGVPVVSTEAIPGPVEILSEVDPAMRRMVPVGNDQAFAEAVASLLADPPTAERRRRTAEKTATRYSVAAAAGEYLAIVDAVLAARGNR